MEISTEVVNIMCNIFVADAYLEKNSSQQPAIELLQSMGYTYISPQDCEAQRGSRYHVLLKDILRGQLRRINRYAFAGAENEFSAANIERAMEDLEQEPAAEGLVRASPASVDLPISSGLRTIKREVDKVK